MDFSFFARAYLSNVQTITSENFDGVSSKGGDQVSRQYTSGAEALVFSRQLANGLKAVSFKTHFQSTRNQTRFWPKRVNCGPVFCTKCCSALRVITLVQEAFVTGAEKIMNAIEQHVSWEFAEKQSAPRRR